MPQNPPDPTNKPDYLIEGATFPFHKAFLALCDGYAIKRARWLCYWIIDPDDSDNVLMKCKDGTVVSMKSGCQGLFTLANATADDWIVLKEGEKAELDLVQSSKCLVKPAQNDKPEQPMRKTPADFGLPLPPRGWKLRWSERSPNLFQLVFVKGQSQPFSVAEATMWADFYGFTYNGRLSSEPLTYGFSRTTPQAPAADQIPPTDDSVLVDGVPAADAADTVSPDNPFGDTKVEPESASVTTTPPPPGTTITITNGKPDNKEAAGETTEKTAADFPFPDPDPTGLPDGARITRNCNRVTVHLSDNFPRNLQRTQEIASWAARYNLSLIDDKSMLGRMVFAFTEQ